jgi:hypothetical protein
VVPAMIGTLFASSSTYLWAVAVLMGGAIASINNPIGYGFLNSGINTMDDGRSQCFDWAIASHPLLELKSIRSI